MGGAVIPFIIIGFVSRGIFIIKNIIHNIKIDYMLFQGSSDGSKIPPRLSRLDNVLPLPMTAAPLSF